MLIVFRKKADLSKIPFIVILEPIHPHVGLSGLQSLLRKKKKKKKKHRKRAASADEREDCKFWNAKTSDF